MMKLKLTPTEAKVRWGNISGQVQIITKDYLNQIIEVDGVWLEVQDGMELQEPILASVSLLDRFT